jgi:hypothetical protein
MTEVTRHHPVPLFETAYRQMGNFGARVVLIATMIRLQAVCHERIDLLPGQPPRA